MGIKERILIEMVENKEDEIVRELRGYPSFDEEFIRRRYKELTS